MKVDGKRLQYARKCTDLNQTEAAVIAGISERTLQRYEAKGGTMNLHIARALAKAYNVAVKSLEVHP